MVAASAIPGNKVMQLDFVVPSPRTWASPFSINWLTVECQHIVDKKMCQHIVDKIVL